MSEWTDQWQKIVLNGYDTKAGQTITIDNATRISAVYGCVKVLSEAVASLPLFVYHRMPRGGREEATGHPLYALLKTAPNPWLTAYEWKEMLVGHLCLRGNHFSYIQRNKAGRITQLIPMDCTRFEAQLLDGGDSGVDVQYIYTDANSGKHIFNRSQLVHVKLFSEDGLMGLSPIEQARETLGIARASETYGAKFFSNNARPGGVLETTGRLSPDAAKRLKESWDAAYAGAENAHRTVVLEEGLSWKSVGLSNEDSQYLELRAFTVEEICRFFKVPCILVGHPSNLMTYASSEQLMLSFALHTVRPLLARIENVLNATLFSPAEQAEYYCEFKMDALLRGDLNTRYRAYAIGRNWGWLSINDVRELENMNPIENGDDYLIPLNMSPSNEKLQGVGINVNEDEANDSTG